MIKQALESLALKANLKNAGFKVENLSLPH